MEFPSINELLDCPVVALDTECDGLDWVRGNRPFGVALAWRAPEGSPWATAWGDTPATWYGDIREDGVKRYVQDAVRQLKRITGWHVKFDAHMCRETGIKAEWEAWDCAMVRECLLDENQYDYSLERVSQDRLRRGKREPWAQLAALFGGKPTKSEQITNLVRAPREVVSEYATEDAALALENWYEQENEIESQGLQSVAHLERRLLAVVTDMERLGVRVNVDRAQRAIPALTERINSAQSALNRLAGRPINANSPPQVKALLGVRPRPDGFWETKDGVILEPTESGKSGQLKAEKLYQCKLPEAGLIAQIRGFLKARDTFLQKYICEMSYEDYIHANINQTRSEEGDGTYTGRFSITDPALQQIHKRNKALAAIVRACFIPDDDHEWACCDWSQKDFRIFAHYVDDPRINQIYLENPRADFHRVTSDITGLPRDRDEKTGGANAKQMNLGLIFGMSAGRMAKEMNLPYTRNERGFYVAGPEAQALFAMYHSNIPGAERLKQSVASVARSRGFIKTLLGRRLRFPNSNEAYKAAGILFQSQAAESMKAKLVELHEALRGLGCGTLRLTVHDEFDMYLSKGRNRSADSDIQALLERFDGSGQFPLKYRIPITSDFGVGTDWWEASK